MSRILANQNGLIRVNPRRFVAGFRPIHFAISLNNQLIQGLSINTKRRRANADSDPRKPVLADRQ